MITESLNTELTINGNEVVTATFEQEFYALDLSLTDDDGEPAPGAGSIEQTPPADAQGYTFGEEIELSTVLKSPDDGSDLTKPAVQIVTLSGDSSLPLV